MPTFVVASDRDGNIFEEFEAADFAEAKDIALQKLGYSVLETTSRSRVDDEEYDEHGDIE